MPGDSVRYSLIYPSFVTSMLWLGTVTSQFRAMVSSLANPLLHLTLTAMHEASGSPPLLKPHPNYIPRGPSKSSLRPSGPRGMLSSLNSRSFSKVLPRNKLPRIASASRPLRPLLKAAVHSAARH